MSGLATNGECRGCDGDGVRTVKIYPTADPILQDILDRLEALETHILGQQADEAERGDGALDTSTADQLEELQRLSMEYNEKIHTIIGLLDQAVTLAVKLAKISTAAELHAISENLSGIAEL